jgi:hypothetical protein
MHEHNICLQHNFKYCTICDIVYCENCKKEWVKKATMYSITYNQPWITDGTVITLDSPVSHTHEARED